MSPTFLYCKTYKRVSKSDAVFFYFGDVIESSDFTIFWQTFADGPILNFLEKFSKVLLKLFTFLHSARRKNIF